MGACAASLFMSYTLSNHHRGRASGSPPMTSTSERIGEAAEPDREVAREESWGETSCGPGAMGGLWAQAREYIWLDDVRSGIGVKAIALREGVGERHVQYGVKRARARESASSLRDSRARDVLRDRD